MAPTVDLDLGKRLLAKLGLAVGYKILGTEFLATPYSRTLRAGFREAKREKRVDIPVRGTGFLDGNSLGEAATVLAWPGGWVLQVQIVAEMLGLTVITPSGRSMMVMISDDPVFVAKAKKAYAEGAVWVTVPMAREAVGPVPLPDYLAHQLGNISVPALAALANKRGNASKLPPCGSA